MEEEEILELLERNWEAGSAALVGQYQYLLWGICARRLDDPEDIWECVYAALCDFCLQWERFRPEQNSLKHYLIAIADRKALDKYRQNSRWNRAKLAAAREEARTGEAEWRELLQELIEQLDPLDAEILRLRYLEGITYPEISRMLEMKYETVKKRGRRGIEKAKKLAAQ